MDEKQQGTRFPRVIYHPVKGERVVKDAGEHKSHLNDGWQDEPIVEAEPEQASAADPVSERCAAIEARLDALEGAMALLKKKR